MEIIANPTSGKNKGEQVIREVTHYLNSRNISYNVHITESKGHAHKLTETLCRKGAKTIVALGGDGTFHEVLNGMDFSTSRLGFVPAGRGNDYAFGTGISLNPTEAIAAIVAGTPMDTDYIQVDTARCLNIAGTGLDVEVLQHTAHKKNSITYTTSLIHCLLHYSCYPVTVTHNSISKEYKCIMVGVCNGSQFGGGLKLSPMSNNKDGLLDIVIIEKPKNIPAVFVVPSFAKGKHITKSFTTHFQCTQINIDTRAPIELDGEIYTDLQFKAHIVAGGCKTFAPLA